MKFQLKNFTTLSFALLTSTLAFSQSPVLFSIGSENITKDEFVNVYQKNSINKEVDFSTGAVNEYLNLYTNFRLKVKEAKDMHMDTMKKVNGELNTYRVQLAKSYLVDRDVVQQLMQEAYTRMQTEVKCAHILIKCDPNALPADTLKAYKKAMALHDKILKGKLDFNQMAKDSSDDKSAKDNGGELGYITAMQVVYPFETAAYNTKVGDISMPVRTSFGYHIIKVEGTRPSQGTIKVAHIFIKANTQSSGEELKTAESKINDVYGKLQSGGNWEALAKEFSEDKTSNANGGVLPEFSTGKMVPEFEDVAFALKNPGDYSKPVQTKYGWHIIKMVERKPLPPYEDIKDNLKRNIEKDKRFAVAKTAFVNKAKKDYNYTEMAGAVGSFSRMIDSTLQKGFWKMTSVDSIQLKNTMLFTLNDSKYLPETKSFTAFALADFVEKSQRKFLAEGTKDRMVAKIYDQFVQNALDEFELNRLEAKYPDFRNLMGEYRDGILLFQLMDDKVWNKAVQDTVGLQTYWDAHKTKWMGPEKVNVDIWICSSADAATKLRAAIAKGTPNASIISKLNKKIADNVIVTNMQYAKGMDAMVDSTNWAKGVSRNFALGSGKIEIVNVLAVNPPQPKALVECKGYAVADYQEQLEKDWIASLKSKYPVKVNDAVLKSIIK